MRALYELKELLCKELEEYGSKGELTGGTLEVVDKLAHALKNLDKIIEAKEMEAEGSYADGMSNRSYAGGNRMSYDYAGEYAGAGSYARGRGRNARRDSMGRYSSRRGGYSRAGDTEEYVEQLREMMQMVPQEARQHIQKAIQEME